MVVPDEHEFDTELKEEFPNRLESRSISLWADTETRMMKEGDGTGIAVCLQVTEQSFVLRCPRSVLAELAVGVEGDDVPSSRIEAVKIRR